MSPIRQAASLPLGVQFIPIQEATSFSVPMFSILSAVHKLHYSYYWYGRYSEVSKSPENTTALFTGTVASWVFRNQLIGNVYDMLAKIVFISKQIMNCIEQAHRVGLAKRRFYDACRGKTMVFPQHPPFKRVKNDSPLFTSEMRWVISLRCKIVALRVKEIAVTALQLFKELLILSHYLILLSDPLLIINDRDNHASLFMILDLKILTEDLLNNKELIIHELRENEEKIERMLQLTGTKMRASEVINKADSTLGTARIVHQVGQFGYNGGAFLANPVLEPLHQLGCYLLGKEKPRWIQEKDHLNQCPPPFPKKRWSISKPDRIPVYRFGVEPILPPYAKTSLD